MTSPIKEANETEKFRFRDGDEHGGEATFDEIFEGFNDGELSDDCIVFMPKEDQWVSVEKFVEKRKKIERYNEPKANSGMDVDTVKSSGLVTIINKTLNRPVDTSREKKKPSRDSSAWGKTSSITQALPSTLSANKGSPDKIITKAPENPKQKAKSNKRKRGNSNHIRPPPKLMKYVIQGIMQFQMIEEGDRLLLGLSGGKDSMTLLHCLLELKRKLPTNFDIEVCTIDPMTPSFDPSPLIPYVESLGLKYHYVKDNIVERANSGGKFESSELTINLFCHDILNASF